MRLRQLDDKFKVLHHINNTGDILLIAGHHGDEPIGWQMLGRVVKQLKNITIPITIIPIACPAGAAQGTRNLDGKDPNRVYEDYTHGTDWSKRIVDQVIGKKLVMDFHGADNDPSMKHPFIYASESGNWSTYFPSIEIKVNIPPKGSFRWIAGQLGADCITLEGLSRNISDSYKMSDDVVAYLKQLQVNK